MTRRADGLLRELESLTGARDSLNAQIRATALAARAAGAATTDIARAADVTRPTVYRWTAEVGLPVGDVDVADALDRALGHLAPYLSEYTARQVRGRIGGHGVDVKIRAVELATKNLPGQVPDEVRAVLADVWHVIREAQAVHGRTGAWPTRVTLK